MPNDARARRARARREQYLDSRNSFSNKDHTPREAVKNIIDERRKADAAGIIGRSKSV